MTDFESKVLEFIGVETQRGRNTDTALIEIKQSLIAGSQEFSALKTRVTAVEQAHKDRVGVCPTPIPIVVKVEHDSLPQSVRAWSWKGAAQRTVERLVVGGIVIMAIVFILALCKHPDLIVQAVKP